VLAYLLLGFVQAIGMLMIPLGGPGIWIQLSGLALFAWWSGFQEIGPVPLVLLLFAGLSAELIEGPTSGGRIRPVQRRLAAGGGLLGGGAGAVAGFLFPLMGSLFGAIGGSFLGTSIASVLARSSGAGRGSIIGQVVAISSKTGAAVAIASYSILSLTR